MLGCKRNIPGTPFLFWVLEDPPNKIFASAPLAQELRAAHLWQEAVLQGNRAPRSQEARRFIGDAVAVKQGSA